MDSFLFTLALFAFWGLVGFATIAVFSPRLRVIQGVLISPAIGVAVTILPVFFINRAGIPVKDFGGTLFLALATLAIIALAIKRPVFPVRRLLPILGILVLALFLVARPMLNYGFDWVSYSNDDMANYCLGAARFLNHGFFAAPDLDALYQGRDYSQAYWYLYVPGKVRPGSELMLAFVWGSSGFNAHQVFMPVIMALNLALLSAVGGMVTGVTRNRKAPLIAMSLMAVSPLTSLGSLYQLIGQVGGLALLVPSVSLLLRAPRSLKPWRLFFTSIPAFLTIAGLFVWYPEALPFLGLGWFVYVAICIWQDKKGGLSLLIPAGIVGILLLLLLQGTIREAMGFLLFQASMAGKTVDPSDVMFPYMLIPSGISMLWGISVMGGGVDEPLLSGGIALGLALTLWFVWKLPHELRKASPPAIISLVMLILAVKLFAGNVDFGLFKLAMFVQPFLTAVVAMRLSAMPWVAGKWRVKGVVVALLVLCVSSQMEYVRRSTGEFLGGLNEIPHSSSREMNRQFAELLSSVKASSPAGFIADTSHLVMAKYQTLYSIGTSILFPSKQFIRGISGAFPSTAKEIIDLGGVSNSFRKDKNLTAEEISRRWMLIANVKYTPFNAYAAQNNPKDYFSALPMDKVRNHLTFIDSELGIHYYFLPGVEQGDRRNTAFFPMEDDPLFAGNSLSGMGRYVLLMGTNTTPGARMVMEATSTVMKTFESALPLPVVYGESAVPLQFVGRGSGRVFSAPVQPALSGGLPYLSIDMGRDGKQFQNNATGLMKLYGSDIVQDTRRLTTFARDISLISQEDYLKLTPPASISRFPADLANRNLEYSGIYEDGWISERAFFTLASKPDTRYLLIKGTVPQIDKPDFRSTLAVSIDGKEVIKHPLGLGNFELKVPVSGNGQRQRVDLAFDRHQVLPGADLRPAGGKIDFIGFVSDGVPK